MFQASCSTDISMVEEEEEQEREQGRREREEERREERREEERVVSTEERKGREELEEEREPHKDVQVRLKGGGRCVADPALPYRWGAGRQRAAANQRAADQPLSGASLPGKCVQHLSVQHWELLNLQCPMYYTGIYLIYSELHCPLEFKLHYIIAFH